MKLLLFSDLHVNHRQAEQLVARSVDVDVVIGAGDFASVRQGLGSTIAILTSIEKPVVLVPGNNETLEELVETCRGWSSAHVLHGSGVEILGQQFYGIGGGIPVTPFGAWSYDFTEQHATALLQDCPSGCVLVSHSPPKGAVDISSSGESLGSQSVRDAIVDKHPILVVCGHIHASIGETALIGDTTVINAGPEGVVWEL